jgi:hypothetical protein
MNRPTVSGDKLLVSGGALNIKLTNNGNDLSVSKDSVINISYTVESTIPVHNLFFGEEPVPGIFNWVIYSSYPQDYVETTPNEYHLKCRHTGWISPAMIYENSSGTTTVSAKLPAYFTNANTSVYLVFRNMFSVIELPADFTQRKFISNIPVPVGLPVTMVVISRQGNDYYLGHADATSSMPSTGSSSQQMASNPVKVSLEKLNEYLSSL